MLAVATFASVRSANRASGLAERSLLVDILYTDLYGSQRDQPIWPASGG